MLDVLIIMSVGILVNLGSDDRGRDVALLWSGLDQLGVTD